MFQQCEALNPLAVVYALSVQSFKHYNRLARRSCVVRVLGKWNCDARTLSHDHIITSPLGTRWLSCFDSGDARWALELLTKSPPRPIEDICVCPEATLMMSQKTFACCWVFKAVYMYTGFSCPVNSLYIEVGIVFM